MSADVSPLIAATTRSGPHGGPAPIALPDLARRIAVLRRREPPVSESLRVQLLCELDDLGRTVDGLMLRRNAGAPIAAHHVRACCRRYLRLREQWPETELAA